MRMVASLNNKFWLTEIETDPLVAAAYSKAVAHKMFFEGSRKDNIVSEIMKCNEQTGQLEMLSADKFKEEWEKSNSTKAVRDYFEAKEKNEKFLEEELKEKLARLSVEYNAAAKGTQIKDWPKMSDSAKITQPEKETKYNEEIKWYFETAKTAAQREHAQKMHKTAMDEVGKPKTKQEAIDISYEDSARLALEKVQERLRESDMLRLQDMVAAKMTSRTYVETLKHTLEAICTVKTVRSMLWFTEQVARIEGIMSAKQVTFAEGRQAYMAQETEMRKVFGDKDVSHAKELMAQLKLFPDEMTTLNQGASAVVNKYYAMEYTLVNKGTPGKMWEELMRVPYGGTINLNRVIDPQPSHARAAGKKPEQRVHLIGRMAENEMGGAKRPSYGKSPKCFTCGAFGHIAKECTQEKTCYNCGKEGHIAMDCSAPRTQGSHSRPSSRAPTPHRARNGASSSRSSSVARSRPETTPSSGRQNGMSSYGQPERAHKSANAVRFVCDEITSTPSRRGNFCGLCAIAESDCESEPDVMASTRAERGTLTSPALEPACKGAAQVSAISRPSIEYVHIDTAANVNVCAPGLLSDLVRLETPQKLAAFQGTQCTVTHKGVLTVVVADERDSNLTHAVRVEMYAMEGVTDPIISWESMAAGGAEMRLKSGGSTIAFNDKHNTILRIGVDGRMKVARVLYDEKWKIVTARKGGEAPIKSALSTHPRFPFPVPEKRFAPRARERRVNSAQGN